MWRLWPTATGITTSASTLSPCIEGGATANSLSPRSPVHIFRTVLGKRYPSVECRSLTTLHRFLMPPPCPLPDSQPSQGVKRGGESAVDIATPRRPLVTSTTGQAWAQRPQQLLYCAPDTGYPLTTRSRDLTVPKVPKFSPNYLRLISAIACWKGLMSAVGRRKYRKNESLDQRPRTCME